MHSFRVWLRKYRAKQQVMEEYRRKMIISTSQAHSRTGSLGYYVRFSLVSSAHMYKNVQAGWSLVRSVESEIGMRLERMFQLSNAAVCLPLKDIIEVK